MTEEVVVRKRPIAAYVAIIVMSGAITAVIGAFGGVVFPFLAPISSFYPAVAFIVSFGVWFGLWGVLGAGFLGPVIGTILTGTPAPLAVFISGGDIVQSIIPMLAFRWGKFNPELKTTRDWAGHILFNMIIAQAAGATVGVASLYAAGIFTAGILPVAWVGWFVGNVVVVGIVGTILMKVFSGYLKKTALYVQGLLH